MELFYPLAAVLGFAASELTDKYNYTRTRISPNHVMRLVFLGMSLAIGIYIFTMQIPLPIPSFVAFGLVLLIILVSFVGNISDYLSLRSNDLSLRQPVLGFEPILAALFGQIFFPAERSISFLVAIAASFAIVYLGIYRIRLGKRQRRGLIYLLLAVLLYALLPSIYKLVLPYVSPEWVTLLRVTAILLLAGLFLPVKRHKKSPRKVLLGLVSGVACAAGSIASLYAILLLGVTQTMLLVLLTPAIIYTFAYLFFGEKFHPSEVAASAALAAIVVVVTFA